ncbi:MAG: hypothetical protein K6G86_08560 [Bacteroidales bacterium]|nr:hypothetical protein [Bacteroidales bacterium]
MHSEFTEPRTLPGERSVPSIRIDAGRLHALLLRAEMMMTAVDRRRYADRAIRAIEDVIRDFTLAYDFEDERLYYLRKMWGDIAVFIDLMRTIGEQNCIRIKPSHEPMTPDQMKLALFNSVASLDEGATKWKKSLTRNKGKTPADGRMGQSLEE